MCRQLCTFAITPGSALCQTLGDEYGKPLHLPRRHSSIYLLAVVRDSHLCECLHYAHMCSLTCCWCRYNLRRNE